MKFTPLPHQALMVEHCRTHPRSIIAAGCGLGKTSATLHTYDLWHDELEANHLLVLAPLRVARLTWPYETRRFFPHLTCRFFQPSKIKRHERWSPEEAHVWVTNYEQIPALVELLARQRHCPFDAIVFDELTKLKNASGKRFKTLYRYLNACTGQTRRIGLTGTLAANGLEDIFGQALIIDDGRALGTSKTAFTGRFFNKPAYGYGLSPKPKAREAITEAIAPFTLHLSRADYLRIPDTLEHFHEVKLPQTALRAYAKLQTELLLELGDTEITALNAASLIAKLSQIAGGHVYDSERRVSEVHTAKVDWLRAFLAQHPEPVFVATMYQHQRDALIEHLGAVLFDDKHLEPWNRKEIRLMCGDPRSIGHGLNLQHGGSTLVWFSPTWSRELHDQTVARFARQGQTQETNVHYLIADGTADEIVVEALRRKDKEQHAVLEAISLLRQS